MRRIRSAPDERTGGEVRVPLLRTSYSVAADMVESHQRWDDMDFKMRSGTIESEKGLPMAPRFLRLACIGRPPGCSVNFVPQVPPGPMVIHIQNHFWVSRLDEDGQNKEGNKGKPKICPNLNVSPC